MIFTAPGSAGFGLFTVDPSTGRVLYDPQGSGGGWATGVTTTRLRGLVLDAGGALVLADLAAVDVSRSAIPTYATDGMIPTLSRSNKGPAGSTLSGLTRASIRADVTRAPGEYGVIYEAGAEAAGLALWVFDDVLYFRCGLGTEDADEGSSAYFSAPAPTGEFVVEFSGDVDTGKAALYIDGTLLGVDTFDYYALSGSNTTGIGEIAGNTPVMIGIPSVDRGGAWAGAVTVTLFDGQVTVDVA